MVVQKQTVHYHAPALEKAWDVLAEETPLTINWNGQELATLLCSPSCQEELVVGFLAGAGLLQSKEEILSFSLDIAQGLAWITSSQNRDLEKQVLFRRYVGSGCGGGTGFYNLEGARAKQVESNLKIDAGQILDLMRQLQEDSPGYKETRGTHNAALATTHSLFLLREDIGRHNAVDKLFGRLLLDGLSGAGFLLVVSGRVSSEVLLKTAGMGVPVILSRSVPTSLAVEFAEALGITIVGYIRGGRFIIYTHPDRIMERQP